MVIILRAVSGAGKSTWVRENFGEDLFTPVFTPKPEVRNGRTSVYSADHYFLDVEGGYNFEGSNLPLAHGTCLKKYVLAMLDPDSKKLTHIVDNTNTSVAEIAPYAALALAYGHELRLVTLHIDPVIAAERNVHGAPATAVARQAERLLAADLMPWWPNEDVVVGTLDRSSLIHLVLKHVKKETTLETASEAWLKAQEKARKLGAEKPDEVANEVLLRLDWNVAIA